MNDYDNIDIDEISEFYDEPSEIPAEFIGSLRCFGTFENFLKSLNFLLIPYYKNNSTFISSCFEIINPT